MVQAYVIRAREKRDENNKNTIEKYINTCIKNRKPLESLPKLGKNFGSKKSVLNHFLDNRKYEDDYGYVDYFIELTINENSKPIKFMPEIISKVCFKIIDLRILGGELTGEHIESDELNWQDIDDDNVLRFKFFVLWRYRLILEGMAKKIIHQKEVLLSLEPISTTGEICRVLDNLDKEILNEYMEYMIEEKFFKERRPLKHFNFLDDVICDAHLLSTYCHGKNTNRMPIYNHIKQFIESRMQSYYERLVKTNKEQVSLQNDKWILVQGDYIKNNFKYFDFSVIESETFRYEVKLYMMDRIKSSSLEKINSLSLIIPCVNFLYEQDCGCNSFGCIELEDAVALYLNQMDTENNLGKKYSITSVKKQIGEMRKVTKYLMEYQKSGRLSTPRIENNYFDNISFKNIQRMYKKTEIIPDEIVDALVEHKEDLGAEHELILDIFINTGIRLKQVLDLKKDCLEYSKEAESYMITFYESKNRNHAKKVSVDPLRQLLIPDSLADAIKDYRAKTDALRKKFSKDNLFIKLDMGRNVPTLIHPRGVAKMVNALIEKHNIVDANGELWNFTTRQVRKTVVANMIENGATKAEVAYVLGHFNNKTLEKYYADVKQKRVDDMNNEFFKNKFRIDIGEDNLKQFSEAERKVLYIGFLSDYRRTELGYCSKHYSEGVCGKFVGGAKCSKCNKLCTGKDFKDKWEELLESTEEEISRLESFYKSKKIDKDTYQTFREYQAQINNRHVYKDILKKM